MDEDFTVSKRNNTMGSNNFLVINPSTLTCFRVIQICFFNFWGIKVQYLNV